MRQYKCVKVVNAFRIHDIIKDSVFNPGLILVLPILGRGDAVYVDKEWMGRCAATDEDRGYLVEYDDGFRSWSPSEAFEEGYVLMEDEDHDEAG